MQQSNSSFNTSAELTLSLTGLYDPRIYINESLEFVECNAKCQRLQWNQSGNVLLFNVTSFTQYTTREGTNLTIFDEADPIKGSIIRYADQQIKFFANYSNSTHEPVIPHGVTNAACNISFNITGTMSGQPLINMTYNVSSLFYEYNRTFDTKADYWFNISCTAITNANISLVDNATIPNTLPGASPYLQIDYRNLTATTNRTPIFIWQNSTEADSEIISYHLQVDDNPLFNNPEINVSALPPTEAKSNTTYYSELGFIELDVDTRYFWRVRANDSDGYGNWSNGAELDGPSAGRNTSNFTVNSLLSLTFINNAVEFGSLNNGENRSTISGNPLPISAENTGNINVNISINASRLFESVAFNSSFYQFKLRANESGAFDTALSTIDWKNMSHSTTANHVVNLTWRNIRDDFLVDLNVSVPFNEYAGVKTSVITLTISSNSEK